jgi:hypothetical protein
MLKLRPIVVNDSMVVLGGNMRLKACKQAGIEEVYIIKASELTEEQEKEFIIKDNVGYGEWDWDMIANEWDAEEVTEWGLDIKNWDADYLKTEDKIDEPNNQPRATDDNYSTFELIMLHENKLHLLDTLNQIKNNFLFEKQEEALMELIRVYETK